MTKRFALFSGQDRITVLALLALGLTHALVSAHWGAPDGLTPETTGTWAVDSIGTVQPLREASALFTRDEIDDLAYPLFHQIVLAGAYAPYVAVALLTGKLTNPGSEFPYGATDPSTFFPHLNLIASLVSALMAVGIALAVYLCTRELFGRRAALPAMLLTILFPPFGYYGMTSNPDIPYLFWMMLAVWQLLRAARTQKVASFALTGVFVGLSAATKDPGGGFFLLLPLLLPWLVANAEGKRDAKSISLALFDRRVVAAAIAVLLSFGLGNNLFFGGLDGFLRHLNFNEEVFRNNVATDFGGLVARQPELALTSSRLLLEMVGPATWILIAIGLWRAVRSHTAHWWIPLLLAATYYAAVVMPTVVFSRHMFGVMFLALPFAGLGALAAFDSGSIMARRFTAVVAVVAVSWQIGSCWHLHYTLWNDSRFELTEWMDANVPAGSTIETQTQVRYLPRLQPPSTYSVVGNSYDPVDYSLRPEELTVDALAARSPDFVLVLADSGVSGDPERVENPFMRSYFDSLLSEQAGYRIVARFETPSWLPYRQLTAGTQPTSILLQREGTP